MTLHISELHIAIHNALIAAMAKHGESKYGVCAQFDAVAVETKIEGFYKLKFVSEDIARAVQAKLDASAIATTKEN